MNVCRANKQAYESLKALNNDFVLECRKRGDARTLSEQNLIDLQRHKLKLESARDTLEEEIQGKAFKLWRNLERTVLNTSGGWSYDKDVRKKNVSELIAEEKFQATFFQRFVFNEKALSAQEGYLERLVVESVYAAQQLRMIPVWMKREVQQRIEAEDFRGRLGRFLKLRLDDDGIQYDIGAIVASTKFGILPEGLLSMIDQRVKQWDFRDMHVDYVLSAFRSGGDNGAHGMEAVIRLGFASELGIEVQDNVREEILGIIESESFKTSLGRMARHKAYEGLTYGHDGSDLLKLLYAVKQLIRFSRKYKRVNEIGRWSR